MNAETALDALRREIDAIDDQIHDLIMRRTEVVKRVREVKRSERIKIRPAREAEIVYRLLARHRGPFPRRELCAMWRDLIVATLSFEGPFSVAVHTPEQGSGYWDLARDQYGSFTPMTGYGSARQVVEDVRSQKATVGVLPFPNRDDTDPWWCHLVTTDPDAPRIIARLPFAGPGNGRGEEREALVVCPVVQEPTGRDRSIFALESEAEIGLSHLASAMSEAGLPPTFTALSPDPHEPGAWLYLAEVDDFVADRDDRYAKFRQTLARPIKRLLSLGGYPTPLAADELISEPVDDPPAEAAGTGGGSP